MQRAHTDTQRVIRDSAATISKSGKGDKNQVKAEMVEEAKFGDVTGRDVETQSKEILVEDQTRKFRQEEKHVQEPCVAERADDERHEHVKKDGQVEEYNS